MPDKIRADFLTIVLSTDLVRLGLARTRGVKAMLGITMVETGVIRLQEQFAHFVNQRLFQSLDRSEMNQGSFQFGFEQ
ncbi:hypothetical protein A2U01_0063811 [Trifolium medium]|uniref:Uncharacterized protein n=1 Tax=Trifolium medium TaxID=97028 RepID=A0A392S2Z5_9FABA|nr:hypothetical protein [Trifolium medium]